MTESPARGEQAVLGAKAKFSGEQEDVLSGSRESQRESGVELV